MARQHPVLGAFILQMRIPSDEPRIRVEKTGEDSEHYTIWAGPVTLIEWVQSVQPL